MNQPSVDESLSEKAMVAFLQEAIASLSPQFREAFLLSSEEQLSYREIAQRMQISVSTVEKHIAKALQVIRFIFAQWNRILLVGGILVATVVRYILFDTCWD